jgi:hypothetical protein
MRTIATPCCAAAALLIALCALAPAADTPAAEAAIPSDLLSQAKELAYILGAAEQVIADNQDLIDDPAKGDKGLTADVVMAKAAEHYQKATTEAMPSLEGESRRARQNRTLVTIMRSVLDKAQPLINEPGKGYKSFLSPIFTDQVAREFCRTMEGTAAIRITAPTELLRNRRHKPDEWENDVIEKRFKAADWVKGAVVVERVDYKGKPSVRLLVPQYYDQSCLKCHGEPKGERDINGGRKEGAKLGDLGGALSVVLFLDN